MIYFLPAILSGRVLCPADGIIQNVPFRATFAQMLRTGHLPLWDPYIFGGMPFLAAAQPGVLYALNWFYLFFSPAVATNLMVVATYIVAGLGAFLYARKIGTSMAGAMITALVWQFGGATIGQISHINIVQTAALLPWVLWSLEAYVQTASFKRGTLIAIFIAVQFFAGHQQTFVYSLLLVIAYSIAMSFADRTRQKRYFSAIAFAGVGIVLAAVQILPTFELLRNSVRASSSYDFFTSYSMPKRFVFALFAPYLMGGGDGRLFRAPYVGPPYYPEMIGYVGLLALMLAIAAVVIKRDARTKFWAITFGVCLLLAMGRYAPLQIYQLIYFVPPLNLFRVPARHLMEVDFALAVLAGLGLTRLQRARQHGPILLKVALIGIGVFLVTLLTVTWLRPAEFRLDRDLPVTILRAAELFLPIVIAAASAWALWRFGRRRRGALALLFAVLLIDLVIWGQSSGWYPESPRNNEEYWRVPEVVQTLRRAAPGEAASFRILTVPHVFDPSQPVPSATPEHASAWTQADLYMLHGIHNAAGYDGFGLERYQKMAGAMKVWGELTDPEASLRGDSREIDLLNVRFVVTSRQTSEKTGSESAANAFAQPFAEFSGYRFAANDFGLPAITKDRRIHFEVPPVEIDRIALVTNLAWAENVPDNAIVAHVRLEAADGRNFELPLRAGADTSEWAYDRADIRARIRHRRATVATSYDVDDTAGAYQGHTFVTALALPEKIKVVGGEITVAANRESPDLSLGLFRISLVESPQSQTYALRRDSVRVQSSTEPPSDAASSPPAERWKFVGQTRDTRIYENARALPRVWLASDVRVLDDNAMLEVIRSGKFSDGSTWEPARTALIESDIANKPPGFSQGVASITKYEPNRIEISTKANAPSVLVLSENHYPGWRAYVDGRFVETLRVDYNLRGVALPAGEHTVQFVYRPKSVIVGFSMSLLTSLGLIGWMVIRSRRGQAN